MVGFFSFALFSIHCLQVMYLLKKSEKHKRNSTSQDQLGDSRAVCCDWHSDGENKC